MADEIQANTTTANDQQNSSVAMDASGDFVVVWESRGPVQSEGFEIYGQRYDAAGVAQGTEFRINTTILSEQRQVQVAMDADGDFVVVWQGGLQDGALYGIYAQRYNAAGVAQGGEFRVNTTTADTQMLAQVAMDSDGDFVVVWQSRGQDGSGEGTYGQRFNAAGVAQGGEFRVNTTTANDQFAPAVAMDSDGDFVVVWQSIGQDGNGAGIYAQRYNAAGVAQGGEFLVNTRTAGEQRIPAVAMDADGDFVVIWQSGYQDGSGQGVYAQRFNAAGVAQGAEFRVNTTTRGSQSTAAVAMEADGDFLVTWVSEGQDGSSGGIYGQRYAANGRALGGEFRVNVTTADTQTNPAVALDSDGDAVVAWQSRAQDGSGFGVFFGRFAPPVNTVPSDITLSATTVVENAAGAVIGTLGVVDPDAGDTHSWAVSDSRFEISGTTLRLKPGVSLDFEAGASVALDITVTDAGGLSRQERFTITVSDVLEAVVRTGTAGPDGLTGTALADTLIGLDGADTLNGGAGADSLVGGAGTDLYYVDDPGDQVVELPGSEVDAVLTFLASYSLAALPDVENLIFLDGANATGTGNAAGNFIVGHSGADTLDGGLGNDRLQGNTGNDRLLGGDGDDVLDGGTGVDRMFGGLGDDSYTVDDAGDVVSETGGGGVDTVRSSIDFTLANGFEGLVLLDSAVNGTGNDGGNTITGNTLANLITGLGGADVLIGGDSADTLLGGIGADTLDGGTGAADSLVGGANDDVYVIRDLLDIVVEVAGGGTRDEMRASLSLTLAAEVEILRLLGSSNLTGTGNAGANQLLGNAGHNLLAGLGGNDTLNGAGGADTLQGGDGNDVLNGQAGADLLQGGAGNDLLTAGGDGDTLEGGAGEDRLTGAAGFADSFRWASVAEAKGDRVLGFEHLVDRLEFARTGFGNLAAGALGAANFTSNTTGAANAASGTPQFIYETDSGLLWFDADGSGAGAGVAMMQFSARPTVTAADIFLTG